MVRVSWVVALTSVVAVAACGGVVDAGAGNAEAGSATLPTPGAADAAVPVPVSDAGAPDAALAPGNSADAGAADGNADAKDAHAVVCLSPDAGCGPDCWKYDDTMCDICDMSDPSCVDGYGCWQVGDGLCYQLCSSDADCTDPDFPYCAPFGLDEGNDYTVCHPGPKVCRSEQFPGCW